MPGRSVGAVSWVSEEERGGIRERGFVLERAGRSIPGLIWTAAGAGAPDALVLVGHGASGSKRQDYVRTLVRRLVGGGGLAAVAIDGPVHGERRADRGRDGRVTFLDFAQAWSTDPTMTDEMVADWRACLDFALAPEAVGPCAVGYWGLSMGTIIGLPLVAAEPRIGAAVFGLMGLTGPTRERITADAPRIACPVLLLTQWDDELFPRDSAFALFDLLGSARKTLHANPGSHGALPGEELAASERFLRRHLLDGAGG